MTTARYVLCPGPVRSVEDGQVHHISAGQLQALYGAPPSQCLVMPTENRFGGRNGLRDWVLGCLDRGELIALRPRARREDYRLPEVAP